MVKIGLFILVFLCSDVLTLKQKISDIEVDKRKAVVNNYWKSLEGAPDENTPDIIDLNDEDGTDANSERLVSNPIVPDNIYISRWLKMLVEKIETHSYYAAPNALVIPLNSDSISKLKMISTKNLSELDDLVSNFIDQTIVTTEASFDWTTFLYKLGCLLFVALLSCLIVYLSVIFIMRPIYCIIGLVIFFCIFWHFMHLYKKEVAHQHAQLSSMQVPAHCKKDEFSLLDSIKDYFKSFFIIRRDCEKYYEALMVDPIWKVSPSMALSETLSSMIFQPLYSGSKAINTSLKLLFDDLSAVGITFFVVFSFLFLILIFNYCVKLPFFLGSIEPGSTQPNYVQEVRPYNALNTTSDFVQSITTAVEKMDQNVSRLIQNKLPQKSVKKDDPKRIKNNENGFSNEEKCDLGSCCSFKLTSKECQESEKLKLQDNYKKHHDACHNDCKKHCDSCNNSVKNTMCTEDVVICAKNNNASLSNNNEPSTKSGEEDSIFKNSS